MLASLAAPVVDRLRSLSRGELIRPGDPGYAAAQEHGLVCPIGTVGRTGVGGLTLGGGVGRLQRPFGLTVDNLTAVELVTTDGRHVRAIEVEQPELFWAMRGAGTNFGVSRGDRSRHGRYRTAKCGLRVARPLVNR